MAARPVCPECGGRFKPPHVPKIECRLCWAAYGRWRHAQDLKLKVVSRGRARGGGQSSKAKGRSACQLVQRTLLAAAPWLGEGDIFVKTTSQRGVDLHLSPRAREWFIYAIESKNVESLNIWAALQQADAQAAPGQPAVVFFKRAHTDLFAALRASEFLKLLPCPQNEAPNPSLQPSLPPPLPETVSKPLI